LDYYSVGLGFLFGLVTYRMLINILGIGYSVKFFKTVEQNCIMLLAAATESIAYIQQIKYNYMADLGVSESIIKTTQNIEEHNFELWKASVISNVKANYPKYIEPSYEDWEQALKILDGIYNRKRT
jgi:hypothetical protein